MHKKPIIAVPNKIAYEGRSSSLQQLYTEPIDLSRINESTVLQARIVNIPPGVSLFSSQNVEVHIEVEALRIKTEFTDIPVTVRGSAEGDNWTVEPESLSVFVLGDAETMKNLTPDMLGLRA